MAGVLSPAPQVEVEHALPVEGAHSAVEGVLSSARGGDLALSLVSPDVAGEEWPDYLSLDQLDEAASLAGWPMEAGWWPEMRRIISECECRSLWRFAHNTADPNSGSFGLAQLNGRQHFDKAGEDFESRFDPVVNLRTALWLRTARGRFGGGGGWSCADKLGIR